LKATSISPLPNTVRENMSVPSVSRRLDPETLYTKEERIGIAQYLKIVISYTGYGSFGKVYKGYDRRTRIQVAIKVIDMEATDDDVDEVMQEIAILSQLNSPYITKYYGSYLKGLA
jgi:serine/threonine-protein kinase 24/25/MST4